MLWPTMGRFVASYILRPAVLHDIVTATPQVRRGWMTDRGRDDDPERVDHQREDRPFDRGVTMRQRDVMLSALLMMATLASDALGQGSMRAEERLKERKITLPAAPAPVANYVRAVRVGNLLFVSGTTSRDLKPFGKVGKDLTVDQGYQAARHAGLLLLANVRAELGSLDRVKRVVKVLGMVNSVDGFGEQPAVINGFSDLMVEVFGEAIGKHARSAVGMAALPGNAPVEVEAILEVE